MNDRRVIAGPPGRRARPSQRRHDALIAAGATVLALWFGLAAPSTSPVGPSSLTAADPATASEAVDPAAQTGSVSPTSPNDPERRGRPAVDRDDTGQQGRRR